MKSETRFFIRDHALAGELPEYWDRSNGEYLEAPVQKHIDQTDYLIEMTPGDLAFLLEKYAEERIKEVEHRYEPG